MSETAATGGEEDEYALVMPFVVCSSEGGPYESRAFVAGFRLGTVDATLRLTAPIEFEVYLDPAEVPQADLIAMHHGYTLTTVPWDEHPDEWVYSRFIKAAPLAEDSND